MSNDYNTIRSSSLYILDMNENTRKWEGVPLGIVYNKNEVVLCIKSFEFSSVFQTHEIKTNDIRGKRGL